MKRHAQAPARLVPPWINFIFSIFLILCAWSHDINTWEGKLEATTLLLLARKLKPFRACWGGRREPVSFGRGASGPIPGRGSLGLTGKWAVCFLCCFDLIFFNQFCWRAVFSTHNKREKIQTQGVGLALASTSRMPFYPWSGHIQESTPEGMN